MTITSSALNEYNLSYTRCTGSITIEQVFAHVAKVAQQPELQADFVVVDARGCSGSRISFGGIFAFVSKFQWSTSRDLTRVKREPDVHFLVPDDGIYGAVRQLQSLTDAIGGMKVYIHTTQDDLTAAIPREGVTFDMLVAAAERSTITAQTTA